MIPVTQDKVVVRNSNGEIVVRGNCYAAAIASLLELPLNEVPNVETLFHVDDFLWCNVMRKFCESRGYELCNDIRFRCFHPELIHESDLEDCEKYREELKDQYYMISGPSPRGVSHITIWKNGEMVHDPHPTREGIISLENFESLQKIVL